MSTMHGSDLIALVCKSLGVWSPLAACSLSTLFTIANCLTLIMVPKGSYIVAW